MGNNILDGLQQEIDRASELLEIYKRIQSAPYCVLIIEHGIKEAKEALTSGDVIKCIEAYRELEAMQQYNKEIL